LDTDIVNPAPHQDSTDPPAGTVLSGCARGNTFVTTRDDAAVTTPVEIVAAAPVD
jgi:hypothetical protein